MTKPTNKRTRPKTLRDAIYQALIREYNGVFVDHGPSIAELANAADEAVRDYLDPPGPEVFKHPSKPRKAPIVRDEMAEHDPWDS